MGCMFGKLFSRRQNTDAASKDSKRESGQTDTRYAPSPSSTRAPAVPPQQVTLSTYQGKKIAKAIYTFKPAADRSDSSSDNGELGLRKGDVVEILKDTDNDWWLARNVATGEEGYIPCAYVALENSFDKYEWFHGNTNRSDAEKLLENTENPRGTFLIRESESKAGTYVVSILDDEPQKGRLVKHYRIRNLDDGGFYITTSKMCPSLDALVEGYSLDAGGLCCPLFNPCPKLKPQTWDLSRVTRDRWEISRDELQFGKTLGSGNFGDVVQGIWKGKTQVAIKTLKIGSMEPEKFLAEAAIMKQLRHNRIVRLYAVCSLTAPILIVTELMSQGSLISYLKKYPNLPLKSLVDIGTQVADGMRYIEQEKLIHRDIAARNILVGDNNNVKIGDFGLARLIPDELYKAQKGAKCPVRWTAPEALFYQKYTIKSDVWAYGILLVEIWTGGEIPFKGLNNHEIADHLQRGRRPTQPTQCPDKLFDLMQDCWNKEPVQRPTFEYIFRTMDDFAVSMETSYKEADQF